MVRERVWRINATTKKRQKNEWARRRRACVCVGFNVPSRRVASEKSAEKSLLICVYRNKGSTTSIEKTRAQDTYASVFSLPPLFFPVGVISLPAPRIPSFTVFLASANFMLLSSILLHNVRRAKSCMIKKIRVPFCAVQREDNFATHRQGAKSRSRFYLFLH